MNTTAQSWPPHLEPAHCDRALITVDLFISQSESTEARTGTDSRSSSCKESISLSQSQPPSSSSVSRMRTRAGMCDQDQKGKAFKGQNRIRSKDKTDLSPHLQSNRGGSCKSGFLESSCTARSRSTAFRSRLNRIARPVSRTDSEGSATEDSPDADTASFRA